MPLCSCSLWFWQIGKAGRQAPDPGRGRPNGMVFTRQVIAPVCPSRANNCRAGFSAVNGMLAFRLRQPAPCWLLSLLGLKTGLGPGRPGELTFLE